MNFLLFLFITNSLLSSIFVKGNRPQTGLMQSRSESSYMRSIYPDQVLESMTVVSHSPVELAIAHYALHGDHYGGDVLMAPSTLNAGTNNISLRWPGYPGSGRIAYEFDKKFPQHKKTLVLKGMKQYKENTCISFHKRKREKDYIYIFEDDGCYSYLGKAGGKQPLSLGSGCEYLGTVVHELGHAIGFFHEHQRSDRDIYINFYQGNVTEKYWDQFQKEDPAEEQIDGLPYDMLSIMHYGSYAFSKERGVLRSIEGKKGELLYEPYSRPGMNKKDVHKFNRLYHCK